MIRATTIRSSGNDLMAKIDRACLVDWVKHGPSNQWEISTAEGQRGMGCPQEMYKGRIWTKMQGFFGGFGLIYLRLRRKMVLL